MSESFLFFGKNNFFIEKDTTGRTRALAQCKLYLRFFSFVVSSIDDASQRRFLLLS